MTDNTERLTEYRQVYLGSTLAALATPFVVLGYVAAFVDPVVGFGVMSLVPVIPVLIGGFLRFFRRTSATSRHQRAQLAGRYLDAIRNLVTIRLLGAGERIESELRVQGEANRGAIMRLLAGNQIVIVVTDGLFGLVLVCLSAGLVVVRADHMTTAQVTSTILLTVLLLEPLQQVAGFFYIGMGGMASQRALRAFLGSDSGGSGRPRGGGAVTTCDDTAGDRTQREWTGSSRWTRPWRQAAGGPEP
ncbi:MAG: ABC transporter transmembrane domain-containing protein [Microthrixaceae bacterium]|nr:ABC transporter transmembrane domain-containing protein [Microthrixaceae bacterium]